MWHWHLHVGCVDSVGLSGCRNRRAPVRKSSNMLFSLPDLSGSAHLLPQLRVLHLPRHSPTAIVAEAFVWPGGVYGQFALAVFTAWSDGQQVVFVQLIPFGLAWKGLTARPL